MLDKIKKNINTITLVSAIVAIAVITPTLFGYLFGQSNSDIYSFIYYGGLVAANVFAALMAYKNNNALLSLIVVSLMGVQIVNSTVSVIERESYAHIPYLLLYGSTLVLYFISLSNNSLKKFLAILLLICLSFSALSLLSGSATGLSVTLTLLIIMSKLYLTKEGD